MYETDLQQLFGFDDEDLAANRSGFMTTKQEQDLRFRSFWSRIGGVIAGVFFFGLAALLGLLGYGIATQVEGTGEKIIWPAFFGFFALIMILLGILFGSRVFRKASTKVERLEGPINIVKQVRSHLDSNTGVMHDYTEYEMSVAGTKFLVPGNASNYMMQGDSYVIYYVNPSTMVAAIPWKNILSVEKSGQGVDSVTLKDAGYLYS